jgi:acyl-CoA thioesterase-1
MKEQAAAAGSTAKLAFTEWLFHGPEETAPMFMNMGGAVCTGGFLNALMRVSDIVPVSDMTGIIEFGGIYKKKSQVFGTPAYWAFRMYSTSGANRLVESRTDGESYQIRQGNRRLPEIDQVPYLDVVAALNEESDRLVLFAVNRHLTRDLEARVSWEGFEAAGPARIQTLRAPHIYIQNDELRPETVVPRTAEAATQAAGMEYAFPRSSVSVIEVRRKQTDPSMAPVADAPGLPRVLLIGDSISMGYTLAVREMLQGKANVHRVPENAGPTTRGVARLEEWLGTARWDVIHFNFGLHDLKIMDDGGRQVPLEKYEANLRQIVARLKQTGARLVFATTTPVPEGKLNPPRLPADVTAYDAAALRVMKEAGVPMDDLYATAAGKLTAWQQKQNVHFTPEGYKGLAAAVAASITRLF